MHWLAGAHTTDVVGMGDLMVYGDVTDRADHSDELMGDWFSMENWPPLSQQGLNKVIDVEDLSMMFMRMNSGVLASYQQCHFTPDYWRNYTVIGTEGRIENFGDGEGGVIKLWNKRTTYNADGDEQFPIRGDAHGHRMRTSSSLTSFSASSLKAPTPTPTRSAPGTPLPRGSRRRNRYAMVQHPGRFPSYPTNLSLISPTIKSNKPKGRYSKESHDETTQFPRRNGAELSCSG
ncbi:hypothetical protein [Trueperella pyogenes]|uniref:hypothetical protein n=1 Tax=Trueperella pyogenes TaxID=1661 RepID=UPI003DA80068